MKISFKWLQDFIEIKDFENKPEALADVLTKAGLEVEEMKHGGENFKHVVTGTILEMGKHPNADRLTVCKVITAPGVVHQIVCGATNHKANDNVVVALPGAVLPGNFEIKKAVVRSVESNGMLCSKKELGLASESQGIFILPSDAPVGVSFAEYMGLDDITFELKVTANRADCLSHYGLARELSTLLTRPLKVRASSVKAIAGSSQDKIDLKVNEPKMCPRYAGRAMMNVKVGPTPDWMKKRLEMMGFNSINNVVDVTNYVMLEYGQPLHAFDMHEISGGKIIVEKAKAGEKFQTLDGTQLTLSGEELMIKDKERSVAMAGVVGGKNSGVSEKTKDLFVEAAYFSPAVVRRSLRLHGIHTESGYRFARGVDPSGTLTAMNRAVELLQEVAGGQALETHHDFYPEPQKKNPVTISTQLVSDRMGYEANSSKLEDYLKRLGCSVETKSEGHYLVVPPSFRFDLEHEMDLVEEYARLNGYDQIPDKIPAWDQAPAEHEPIFIFRNRVARTLRALGFSQACNMVFVGSKNEKEFLKNQDVLKDFGLELPAKDVALKNPLSEDQSLLRRSLAFGLFQNAVQNFARGNNFGRVFEIGKVFALKGSDYQEHWRLALIAWGQPENLWSKKNETPLPFELKAALEQLLKTLGIPGEVVTATSALGFMHPGQMAKLVAKESVGYFGSVHPELLEENKLRVPVAIAEINLDTLFEQPASHKRVQALPKFPQVHRDLALIQPKNLAVAEVIEEIKKKAGDYLQSVDIFDVYEGTNLPEGQRSVAFHLVYQNPDATLQDETVNKSVASVLQHLQQKFTISLR